MWVMLKALRAPPTHPSTWQLSLLDTELDTLLAFREARQREHSVKTRHTSYLRRGAGRGGGVNGTRAGGGHGDSDPLSGDSNGSNDSNGGGLTGGGEDDDWDGPTGAHQQPITEEDSCPICLDDLAPPSSNQIVANNSLPPITYCRPSCGQNVHVKCFLEYIEHAAKSSYSPETYQVKCLLCRSSWGPDALPWLRRHWAACQKRRLADGGLPAPLEGTRGSDVSFLLHTFLSLTIPHFTPSAHVNSSKSPCCPVARFTSKVAVVAATLAQSLEHATAASGALLNPRPLQHRDLEEEVL
jgi:hypothetical protein